MAREEQAPMTPDKQRRANVRLGLILGTVAIAFFVGFLVKAALFGL